MSSTISGERQTDVRPPHLTRSQTPRPAAPLSHAPAAPQGFIKRHPLLLFYAIAFAISFAGILPVVVLGGVQDGVAPTDPRFALPNAFD